MIRVNGCIFVMDDPREFLTAAMRDHVRLRIRYVPRHDPESEHVVLPRGWTTGSSFFAWDFGTRSYRTFDAAFITHWQVEASDGTPDPRSSVRAEKKIAPPGRSDPSLPVPTAALPAGAPEGSADRYSFHIRRLIRPAALLVLLAGLAALFFSPELRRAAHERAFGTATPLPAPTLPPAPTATATVDLSAVRNATAAAEQASVRATEEAPCYPANGVCFDVADQVIVLALPQNARVLAYAEPGIDATTARTVMRHHIRRIAARSADAAWLQLQLTDGSALWVQAAAVAAQGRLDLLPEYDRSAPQPRRTATP